ncbi:hypothetical protein [Sediminitomix flava]|uniref:Lipoprotein n=1 Tax=Sediminitomix flava TaxID=379075 RepID=A0A315ZBK3_SEDFL|nr:hypothetical protein [Sediminitomix flava]PWJ42682.1 hypothetical protein BC781_102227 [Sediminitomix flava]
MKIKSLFIISICILLFACEEKSKQQPITEGTYIGTFSRNGTYSNVSLTLRGGEFSGESDLLKFPAICVGRYIVRDNSIIEFIDDCVWTADFDWRLILYGEWKYSYENDILIIVNSIGDKYTLTKK